MRAGSLPPLVTDLEFSFPSLLSFSQWVLEIQTSSSRISLSVYFVLCSSGNLVGMGVKVSLLNSRSAIQHLSSMDFTANIGAGAEESDSKARSLSFKDWSLLEEIRHANEKMQKSQRKIFIYRVPEHSKERVANSTWAVGFGGRDS